MNSIIYRLIIFFFVFAGATVFSIVVTARTKKAALRARTVNSVVRVRCVSSIHRGCATGSPIVPAALTSYRPCVALLYRAPTTSRLHRTTMSTSRSTIATRLRSLSSVPTLSTSARTASAFRSTGPAITLATAPMEVMKAAIAVGFNYKFIHSLLILFKAVDDLLRLMKCS